MNMESLTASLHAGLIHRSRPARPLPRAPLHDGSGTARAAAVAAAAVVSLRASDVARARPPSSPRGVGAWPPVKPACTPVSAAAEHADGGAGETAPSRRFGLTVRVGADVREMLLDGRLRTGRTTQSILHDALVDYLGRLGPRS